MFVPLVLILDMSAHFANYFLQQRYIGVRLQVGLVEFKLVLARDGKGDEGE